MAPEARSSDAPEAHSSDTRRRLDSISTMDASLQLPLFSFFSYIALLASSVSIAASGASLFVASSVSSSSTASTTPLLSRPFSDGSFILLALLCSHLSFQQVTFRTRIEILSPGRCLTVMPDSINLNSSGPCSTAGNDLEGALILGGFKKTIFKKLSISPSMVSKLRPHSWTSPSTIFALSDAPLRTCYSGSVPILLREHSVLGYFTRNYRQQLAFETKDETLSPDRRITVKFVSINGILFIHSIHSSVSPLFPFLCDALLEAGIDSYGGFSSDHSIGTNIGGSTFDNSGRRHNSEDLLSNAKASDINVAVYANVENVRLASSSSSFDAPSDALTLTNTLPSSYLEYIGNQFLRELDSKLISAFIVQQASKRLPPVVNSWPLVGGLFRFSKGPNDVFDSLKELDQLKDKRTPNFQLAHGLDLQLSAKQREAIYTTRVRVNNAWNAEEILAQLADQFAETSKVAAAAGHPHIAADSLAEISDIQHKPATVATLVSLEERAGDIDGAAAMLDSEIKCLSAAMTKDNKLDITMQDTASFNCYLHKLAT